MTKPPSKGPCFSCGKETSDDNYCFGCRSFVCESCDKSHGELFGSHAPKDHLSEPEEDET